MTRKERIYAVINGKQSDAVPYFIDLTIKGKKNIANYYGIDVNSVHKHIGNHLLFLNFSHPEDFVPEKVGKGLVKDEFGVTWDTEQTNDVGDWGFVDHPIKDLSLVGYTFPKPGGKGRFRGVDEIVEQNPDKFNLLQVVGIFDTAWHPASMQDMLLAMALDEEFTNKMMDMALEYNIGILEQMPSYIDGVRFLEDWGDQKGVMMGVNYWRKYLKPRLKEMYSACKKKGCAVFIHSCGNITELFPDLIELGVDVIDPIQPEVMDLRFIKKEYGKDVVLFGGLGSQSTIPLGTPEDVVKEAEERLSFLSTGGKYILGPSGAIPTEAPVENLVALIEFCKRMTGEY